MFVVRLLQAILRAPTLVCLALSTTLLVEHRLFSHDTWWHLANGKYMLEFGSIPSTEIFSFTASGVPLHDHAWLSDLVFGYVEQVAGLSGLEVFGLVLIVILLRIIFASARLLGSTGLVSVGAVLIALSLGHPFLILRPHLFSMLFSALLFWLYLDFKLRNGKLIYTMPLIAVLWSNFHGGFLLGPAVLVTLAVFEAIEGRRMRDAAAYARARSLVGLTVFVLLAALIHPSGIEQYRDAFANTPFGNSVHLMIDEWLAPSMAKLSFLPISLLVVLIAAFLLPGCPAYFELVLALGSLFAMLSSWRHVQLFVVFGLPIFAAWVSRAFSQLPQFSVGFPLLRRLNYILCRPAGFGEWPILFLYCLILLGLQSRSVGVLESSSIRERYPEAVVGWIEKHPSELKMFNPYSWGGFLLYRLWPTHKIFIDSRMMPYTSSGVFADYQEIVGLSERWEELLEKYQVQRILVMPNEPLALVLRALPSWRRVFGDSTAVVFERIPQQASAT